MSLFINTPEEASRLIALTWADRSRYLHFFLIKKKKKNYRRYLQSYISSIPFFKNKYIHENNMLFEFSWKHKIEENNNVDKNKKDSDVTWGSLKKTNTFYPAKTNKVAISEQYAPGFMPFYLYDIQGIYFYSFGFYVMGDEDDFDLYAFLGDNLDRTQYPIVSHHTYPDIHINDSYIPPLKGIPNDYSSFQSYLCKDLCSRWEKYPTHGENIDDLIPKDINEKIIIDIGQKQLDFDI